MVDGPLDSKQATSEGHHGEIDGKAVAIGETKDDRGDVGQADPRAAGLRIWSGEGCHSRSKYEIRGLASNRLRKDLYLMQAAGFR
jgi:hypothetical protein